MTPNAIKALKKKIQTAKRQIAMDDDSYRAVLRDYGGCLGDKPSSTDPRCDLLNVLARMRELGFVDTRPARAGDKPAGAVSKQAQLDKIDAYLAEAKLPVSYAVGIARKMYQIEKLEWLTPTQLRGIIAALEKAAKRNGRSTK